MFVTSLSTEGNLGALLGADFICMNSARGARRGGQWTAYLGVSAARASSRIADVGPWWQVRADGTAVKTFENRAALNTVPLVPITVDERGEERGVRPVWTGVLDGGSTSPANCFSFTRQTNADTGFSGLTGTMTTEWTAKEALPCDAPAAVYCFETAPADAPRLGPGVNRVFVTRAMYDGNLGGTSGADDRCNASAADAGLGGRWTAYLGVPNRIGDFAPWYQYPADGGMVLTFNNHSNLYTTPLVPLDTDEFGARVPVRPLWTGTVGGGVESDQTCARFSHADAGSVANVGSTGTNGATWSINGTQRCDQVASLLCFELL